MTVLHNFLIQKYSQYRDWHQTKHHNKIHWGVLVIFTLLVFGTISRWMPTAFAADTVPPTIPTNLTVVAISSSEINLSWIASTDDTGVTGYKIYRCAGSSCTPTVQIAASAVNSYSNTGLTASTAYTYNISAYDSAGNPSAQSANVSATTLAASASPIDNLKPGEWYEVPNSRLRDVAPCRGILGGTCDPTKGDPSQECYNSYAIYHFSHIMDGWNGGAFDTKRDRLIIWGGGHAGWAGNDVYAFDLNMLKWTRVKDASCLQPADTSGDQALESTGYFLDGKPRARHTYNYIQYVPAIDRFCSFGGAGFTKSGQTGANKTDCFNFDTKQWEQKADAPTYGIGAISDIDPVTGHVWVRGNNDYMGSLSEWDPFFTNTWIKRVPIESNRTMYSKTGAIDPKRRKFFGLGGGDIYVWDIGTSETITRQTLTTTGATEIVNASNPGFVYDPVSEKLVAWNSGADVYTLNMDTLVWTKVSPASTNTVIPTNANINGTYGRFRYVPSKNAFIVVNSVDENVYIYKLNSASGAAPDTTLPTVSITSPANNSTVSGPVIISVTASDNAAVAGVQFQVDGVSIGSDVTAPYEITWDSASATAGVHIVKVIANDMAGNSASAQISVTVSKDTTAPTVPTNLTVTAISSSQINLSWTASTDDVGISGYRIYRNGTQSGTSNTASYSDTGLQPSTSYSYTVSVYDAAGNISLQSTSVSATTPASTARILRVGPARTYTKPSQAAAIAQSGDIVEIDAGLYAGDAATWTASNLTIRGIGGKAHLRADGANAQGKGIWVLAGSNTTVENIEFSGATVPDTNGAGIRLDGSGLTVRNCYFHDNENGILGGAGPTSDILIETSEFANNGYGDGQSHNLYIGHARSFTFKYSYSHHAKIGHEVKSRADNNYILYNRITDELTGAASYNIDLPNGGLSYVIGNLIQQGPNTDNATLISYAAEGATNPIQELYLVNNTLVNDRPAGGAFVRTTGAPTAKLINNIFVGPGTVLSGAGTQTNSLVSNNPLFVDQTNFDYHLMAGSPAIDAGTNPGVIGSVDLTPVWQYIHPASKESRAKVNSAVDIGAYEFGNTSNPIDNLKPGEWYMVANSHLRDVAFDWQAVGITPTQNGVGVEGVISLWNSGAYDTKRDRLIVWGGGHAGYAGNEIYAFDINKLKWERLTDPTLNFDLDGSAYYPDGKPAAQHTYEGLEYLASVDKFFVFPGNGYYPGVNGGPEVNVFNFETMQWERKADATGYSYSQSAYDSVTGHAWIKGNAGACYIAEYDPLQDKWTQRSDWQGCSTYYATMDIDPVRRKMVAVGSTNQWMWDISKAGNLQRVALQTTGPQDIVNAQSPGFVYDPVSDKFVAWNGGADVYMLDMDTLVWTKVSPVLTNTVIPTQATSAGTYGRFRYIPSKNAFIVVNSVDENVYIYKLNSGSGTAQDTTSPTTPANLTATTISSSQINLFWTASTDDVGVADYKIYRCAGSGCAPTVQIATSSTNSYSNTGLTASTTYTYAVSAYDNASPPNESEKSSSVSVATLAGFKPSDLNKDAKVDSLDFDILKQDWNRTDKPVSDLNQDGIVDSRDLGIMMSEWTR